MANEKDSKPSTKWTLDQLREIVSAGMAVSEARLLLEDGYDPADVLQLAGMQRQQNAAAATEAQQATAKAMQKAMRPENETHPGISAFSKPKGDVADPRTTLPYDFWYAGYPVHMFPETEHWRELELMTQVKPGIYTVLRKDDSVMKVEVKGERDANGNLQKVEVLFPVSREEKWLIPAKSVLLYQLVHAGEASTKRVFLKGMQEYLLTTLDEPESVPA